MATNGGPPTAAVERFARFAEPADEELDAPSRWWEDRPAPVRFRPRRFGTHQREHTIRVDRTLTGIDHRPREVEGALLHAANANTARPRDRAVPIAAQADA